MLDSLATRHSEDSKTFFRAPAEMPRQWYIKTKGGPRGPITSRILVRLADQGTLKPESLVSEDGAAWFQAKHIVGLEFHDAMSKRWHVRTKRGDAGPFSLPKLAMLVKQGRIRANHAISSDGKHWFKAKRLADLAFDESNLAPARGGSGSMGPGGEVAED